MLKYSKITVWIDWKVSRGTKFRHTVILAFGQRKKTKWSELKVLGIFTEMFLTISGKKKCLSEKATFNKSMHSNFTAALEKALWKYQALNSKSSPRQSAAIAIRILPKTWAEFLKNSVVICCYAKRSKYIPMYVVTK